MAGARVRAAMAGMSAILVATSLMILATESALAATTPAWVTTRYDGGNTGFNPSETYLSQGNVASLAQDWSTELYRSASPLMAGGVVYVGCDWTSLCAMDATTGALRWKTFVGETMAPNSAAVAGKVVYVGGSRPPVEYALDADTGAVIWKTLVSNTPSDFRTTTIVSDGLVIQGTDDGFLFAWDAATGLQRWAVPLRVHGTPAVANGVLYVQAPPETPTLHAIRVTTGE